MNKYKVASYFHKNEFIKKIEGLCNKVQVLQNELMEKDSEIHLMKKQQELQELELKLLNNILKRDDKTV